MTASKGSKVCRPNIYTKQATPVQSGSILEQAKLGQLRIENYYSKGVNRQKLGPTKAVLVGPTFTFSTMCS